MTMPARRSTGPGSDSARASGRPSTPFSRVVRFDRTPANPVLDSLEGGTSLSPRPSNPLDPDGAEARCVMLVQRGERPPQPLLDLLREQTSDTRDIIRAEHPLLAVAHLATLERDRAMRQSSLDDAPTEKSILVVVNREAWRDLSPLFGTVKQLMPAVGIWVCTERIAIEIYAGDGVTDQIDRTDAPAEASGHEVAPDPLDPTDEPRQADREGEMQDTDASVTEEELRDLLDQFGMFGDEDDATDSPPGGPQTP